MRLPAFLFVLIGAFAFGFQQPYIAEAVRDMPKPPKLPVITQPVLPGEGWAPGPYRLSKRTTIYDTWRRGRHVVTRVPEGSSVTLLSGLNEVEKPDLVEVTLPVSALLLKPGDIIRRYLQRGEGNADFWVNKRWYASGDLGWVKNADDSGCQTLCKAQEKQPGRSVWWYKIRSTSGLVGWTDALDGPNMYPRPNRYGGVKRKR